jgi:hypothetical protein
MLRDNLTRCESFDARLSEPKNAQAQEQAWSEAFEHLALSVAHITLDGRLLSTTEQMSVAIGPPEANPLEESRRVFLAGGIMG